MNLSLAIEFINGADNCNCLLFTVIGDNEYAAVWMNTLFEIVDYAMMMNMMMNIGHEKVS
jgi:hypothetical protein